MLSYSLFTLAVSGLLVLYGVVVSTWAERRHAQAAAKLGCKKPKWREYKWPLGTDMIWRLLKADREHILPNEVLAIADVMGVPTWEQSVLGAVAIVTADPKNIQALLATQFNDFEIGEGRRNNFWPLLGNGIFTADGKTWEHSRAMLRPQFAREQVSDLELEENHVQDLLRHLPADFANNDGWTSRVDLEPLFFRLTLDSATEFLFGESVESQNTALRQRRTGSTTPSAADRGKLDWTAFGPCFDRATLALSVRARLSEMYWAYAPRSFFADCREVHKFADYYVSLALNNDFPASAPDEEGKTKERYIFLHELVKATRDPIELRSQLLNILLAGRDTTAGLLGYTFYLLVRHPDIYDKLRATILAHFGTFSQPRNVTFVNLKTCTYLQHVLSEVLRMYANVPINSRRAVQDTTLPRGGGPDGAAPVYVRKGQEVNYVVHMMHHRKDLWGADADEFRPERWIGRKPGWEFLPFNGGPRICLGQQFALTEAAYVTVRLVQRFDKIVNEDPDPVVRHSYSITTAPHSVLVRLHQATE